MGTALIFVDLGGSDAGTRRSEPRAYWIVCRLVGVARVMTGGISEWRTSASADKGAWFQVPARKAANSIPSRPYRKPTQVGEAKSLRRARELWRRNSANWPRTLAIRGACFGRSQKRGGSDCLSKTQHCANTEVDVYGATLAQCWKVNGSGQTQVEATNLSPSEWRP